MVRHGVAEQLECDPAANRLWTHSTQLPATLLPQRETILTRAALIELFQTTSEAAVTARFRAACWPAAGDRLEDKTGDTADCLSRRTLIGGLRAAPVFPLLFPPNLM